MILRLMIVNEPLTDSKKTVKNRRRGLQRDCVNRIISAAVADGVRHVFVLAPSHPRPRSPLRLSTLDVRVLNG